MTSADIIRAAAMQNVAFRTGFDAMAAWQDRSEHDFPREKDNAGYYPPCPYPAEWPEARAWKLGAEQADLEGGSPESWRDGGGGCDGVLRVIPPHVEGEAHAMVAAGRVLGIDALAVLADVLREDKP